MTGLRKEKTARRRRGRLRIFLLPLFSLAAALILLEGFLRLGALLFSLEEEKANRISLSRRDSYVILCLGESMTAGGGLSSYPRQLEDVLNGAGLKIPIAVINRGMPSANSGMIAAALRDELAVYRPDMVIVMMGVLDSLQPLDLSRHPPDGNLRRLEQNLRIFDLTRDAISAVEGLLTGEQPLSRGGLPARGPDPLRAVEAERSERNNVLLAQADYYFIDDVEIEKMRARAARIYQQVLADNPELPGVILRLGVCYRELGDQERAREILEKALRYQDTAHQAMIEIGTTYRLQRQWEQADRHFRMALEAKPGNAAPLLELSRLARDRGDPGAGAEFLIEGLVSEPYNRPLYVECKKQLEDEEVGDDYRQALAAARRSHPDLVNLATLEAEHWEARGDEEAAERVYREIIERRPDAFWVRTALGNLLKRQGNTEDADNHYREADNWSRRNTGTAANYRRLAETVLASGAELACVQYPLAEIEELKEMLAGYDGITLVDNGEVFRQAVERDSYDYYFRHRFPGFRFGHCNARGNRLLAENIAAALLSGPLSRFRTETGRLTPGELSPPIAGRLNLLLEDGVKVEAWAPSPDGGSRNRMIEKVSPEGTSYFLERLGEPIRIRVDFGPGNPRIVTTVGSRHPDDPDHLVMGKDYFSGASVYASDNGEKWVLLADARHREYPGEASWRLWSFPNRDRFRYYEVRIPGEQAAASLDYPRRVNELGMFE